MKRTHHTYRGRQYRDAVIYGLVYDSKSGAHCVFGRDYEIFGLQLPMALIRTLIEFAFKVNNCSEGHGKFLHLRPKLTPTVKTYMLFNDGCSPKWRTTRREWRTYLASVHDKCPLLSTPTHCVQDESGIRYHDDRHMQLSNDGESV